MANFVSSLTGQQINDVMTKIEQGVPEGYAVGEKNGVPVSSSSVYYHNNATYYATNAQASAARAEAAVPASTAGAVFFDRSQSLTESQKIQARTNIGAGTGGGGGRNLVDNGWFSINQRNLTSGSIASSATGTYILDRWVFSNTGNTNTSYSLSQGTLTLNASNISTGSLYISQYIPQLQDGSLTGRKITGSVMFSNGTVQSGTITKQAGTRQSLIGTNTSDFELFINATEWFRFRVNVGKTATIKAIKLEVGESSSLDKDISPNYIEELEKCCYYFERVKAANSNLTIGIGVTDTTGQSLSLPLRVRIKNSSVSSTLSLNGTIRYGVDNLSTMASNWTAGNYSAEMGYYQLQIYGSSAFVGQAPYRVGISANGYLDISAEPMIS